MDADSRYVVFLKAVNEDEQVPTRHKWQLWRSQLRAENRAMGLNFTVGLLVAEDFSR